MPKLSERAAHMPASPIRKLVPFADAARARALCLGHLVQVRANLLGY